MNTLLERLVSWAQNEEMIDQYFTDHGKDCNAAAASIARLEADVKLWQKLCINANAEIERLESKVDKLVCLLAERDAKIDKLEAALEAWGIVVATEQDLRQPSPLKDVDTFTSDSTRCPECHALGGHTERCTTNISRGENNGSLV